MQRARDPLGSPEAGSTDLAALPDPAGKDVIDPLIEGRTFVGQVGLVTTGQAAFGWCESGPGVGEPGACQDLVHRGARHVVQVADDDVRYLEGVDTKVPDGETVSIIPNHCCVVTNMMDEVYAARNGVVEAVYPVAARGKVR